MYNIYFTYLNRYEKCHFRIILQNAFDFWTEIHEKITIFKPILYINWIHSSGAAQAPNGSQIWTLQFGDPFGIRLVSEQLFVFCWGE